MAITERELVGVAQNPTDYSRGFRAQTPGFAQAAGNEIAYYFGGIYEQTKNAIVYGNQIKEGYDYRQSIPQGYESFASTYARTVNPEHAAEVTRFIQRRQELRGEMADTPIGTALLGAMVNPVNLIALPIGMSMSGGRAMLTSTMLRGGAALGSLELGLNLGIEATDPVQSATETLMNTATAAIFGAGATGLFTVAPARRINALAKVREQADTVFRAAQTVEAMGGMTTGAVDRFVPRAQRPLGAEEGIDQTLLNINERLSMMERELASIPEGSGEARIIIDQIDELKVARQPYADEVFFRKIEDAGIDLGDIYRPSKGADNPLINFVSNPFRRALNSNLRGANNAVKGAFVRLAADAGTQLRLHEVGMAPNLSVHQRSVTDMGEFGSTYDSMAKLWAEDTNAPMPGTSILSNPDVNATSLARMAQRDGDTITAWLTDVNRKRLLGGDMTSAQAKAANLIDQYFSRWEARLIETGQLRTRENMAKQIRNLELEIESLNARIDMAPAEGIEELNRVLSERQSTLDELRIDYDNPLNVEKPEPFLPRYWNAGEVRKNREELKNILIRWYAENPYIIRFNETKLKWERIDLSTESAAIAKRADETIETILGNRPDEDGAAVFTGAGRPTTVRSRQLDIPNSLVFKFIEQNPIAVMSNYTARTSASYHFAKEFGGNRGKVVDQMRRDMAKAGVDEAEIQKVVRDFNHLYDRVVGRVIKDPDAWNQRVATVLRDAASLTYLGGAGIAAVGDFGRIVMEHEGQTIVRTAQAMFDPVIRRASRDQVRAAGGALDMLLGSAHMRMIDDQSYNLLSNGKMDRLRNAFHTLNLLGPVTTIAKQFSGALAGHNLIEMSQRVAKGTASNFDVRYLARHGIDENLARAIADSPFQVDPKTGFILPNTDEWAGNYKVPTVDGERVRIIESNEDGTPVGKPGRDAQGRFVGYVPAYYRPNEDGPGGTIYFDREYIEGPMYEQKAWTKPRKEGVNPLPEDAFKTPREWSNFVMLHEIMHTRFSADDLGLPPKSAAYENRINELAMIEHKKAQKVAADVANRFRVAVNTAINNTVMMATPADKPIMMDGVLYVRQELGARIGLEPDPRNPGYSRIENAFIGLPLQFYSYAIANVNKTVGLMMQNAVRSRMMGVVAMLGLGYMVTAIRTPDRVWDNMAPQDKLARSFDMSGVAALYSDLFYTGLQTSLALGGPNFTGGLIAPRYPQQPNAVDAVTNITGAGSAWLADMGRSAAAFATGNYGEGASMFINNLPFSNLWFIKGEVNELGRYMSGN
jgi:hypothetical protein